MDGEVLAVIMAGCRPERPGFFVLPGDDSSNIERCFIAVLAAQEVSFL